MDALKLFISMRSMDVVPVGLLKVKRDSLAGFVGIFYVSSLISEMEKTRSIFMT